MLAKFIFLDIKYLFMITKAEACDIMDRIDSISTKLPYEVDELLKDVYYMLASELYEDLSAIIEGYNSEITNDNMQPAAGNDYEDEDDEESYAPKSRKGLTPRNEEGNHIDPSEIAKKRVKKPTIPNKNISDKFGKLME